MGYGLCGVLRYGMGYVHVEVEIGYGLPTHNESCDQTLQ